MKTTTTKKTKTIWRLANRPTPVEVIELTKANILTKEEAREILVSLETEEVRSVKSLQDEIKFLRELVAKLSSNPTVIIESIREVQKPYKQFDWYQPYIWYTQPSVTLQGTYTTTTADNQLNNITYASGTGIQALTSQASLSASSDLSGSAQNFTDIKTF